VFNAIAEPRRRQIIDVLARGEGQLVGSLVDALGLPQPAVSKHLKVLREVGIVSVSKLGQQRLYRLNAQELKTVHDWVKPFEQYWTHQLSRVKQRAEAKMSQRAARETKQPKAKET
jgi:DNA-binding transcriptional ArsR family regulator